MPPCRFSAAHRGGERGAGWRSARGAGPAGAATIRSELGDRGRLGGWQFAGRDPEARERTALKIIAWSLFALAGYVTVESVRSLTGAAPAEHSTVGITLAGDTGAGKSTLARALATRLDAVVLDKDRIRAGLFPPSQVDYTPDQNDFCIDVMYRTAPWLLRHAPDSAVILDGCTYTRANQIATLR